MKKWKISFLVKAVDASIYELIVMLNELRSLSLGTDVEMYFCITMKQALVDHARSGNTSKADLDLGPDAGQKPDTTLFLKLVYENPNATFPYRFYDFMNPDPMFDISNAEHVGMFFKNANISCPSLRNMVVTWDHGKGYGINPKSLIQQKGALSEKEEQIITDDVNSTILTVEELAAALEEAFQGEQIDVLLMMNCGMQVIDAGYALRHTVNYLVGSELVMNFFGYNYPYIFQALISQPDITARELAKICVSSFPGKFCPSPKDTSDKSSFAFFATDLKQYDFLVGQINLLAKYAAKEMFFLKSQILRAREKCFITEPAGLIDFYSFLFELYKSNRLEEASHILTLLLSTKDLIVIESYVGDSFKPPLQKWNVLPTGFAIYFPSNSSSESNFKRTVFFESTQWRSLLESMRED